MNKHTRKLEELSRDLLGLSITEDSGQLVNLVSKLQSDIEDVFGDLLQQIPGRPHGQGLVWGYGRQSKDDKVQVYTKEGQEQGFRDYHARKLPDLELRWPPFFDLGVSGSVPLFRRKAGHALNTHLRRGDHLIITKFDRAFRSMIDGVRTLKAFELRGINLHVIDFGIDMSAPIGKLAARLLVSYGEFERDMTSTRTKEGLAVVRAQGRPCGGCHAPIGWKRLGRKEKTRYVEDPEERRQVDRIEELLQTMSYQEFDGWAKRTRFVNKHGHPWTRSRAIWAIRSKRLGYPKITKRALAELCLEQKHQRRIARLAAARAGYFRYLKRQAVRREATV